MLRKPVVRATVSLYEAKTHFSWLVPLEDTRARRVPGRGKGQGRLRKDFDAPLPDEVIRGFEGRG